MEHLSADDIFNELDFDPLSYAVELIQTSIDLRDAEKLQACVSLAGYRYAKKKEIAVSGRLDYTNMTEEELKTRLNQILGEGGLMS